MRLGADAGVVRLLAGWWPFAVERLSMTSSA